MDFLPKQKLASDALFRYATFLLCFNYSIKFESDKKNQNDDCLSKAPEIDKIELSEVLCLYNIRCIPWLDYS